MRLQVAPRVYTARRHVFISVPGVSTGGRRIFMWCHRIFMRDRCIFMRDRCIFMRDRRIHTEFKAPARRSGYLQGVTRQLTSNSERLNGAPSHLHGIPAQLHRVPSV